VRKENRFHIKNCYTFYPKPREVEEKKTKLFPEKENFCVIVQYAVIFLFSGREPIYFIENKEKTLRASYDRGTQIFDYMD